MQNLAGLKLTLEIRSFHIERALAKRRANAGRSGHTRDVEHGINMTAEDGGRQRLSEHICAILIYGTVLYHNVTVSNQLTQLQVPTLNVPRTLARLQILRELNRTRVIYVQHSQLV